LLLLFWVLLAWVLGTMIDKSKTHVSKGHR
jgi:hypothetical protein